jgi:adenylylsulfate kinase-like enzyme
MVKYVRKDVEEVRSNMGKLIIIEGTDGSGKQTQTELLYEKLFSLGKKSKKKLHSLIMKVQHQSL